MSDDEMDDRTKQLENKTKELIDKTSQIMAKINEMFDEMSRGREKEDQERKAYRDVGTARLLVFALSRYVIRFFIADPDVKYISISKNKAYSYFCFHDSHDRYEYTDELALPEWRQANMENNILETFGSLQNFDDFFASLAKNHDSGGRVSDPSFEEFERLVNVAKEHSVHTHFNHALALLKLCIKLHGNNPQSLRDIVPEVFQ